MNEQDCYDAKVDEWLKRKKRERLEREAWIGGIILSILYFLSLGLFHFKTTDNVKKGGR